MFKMLQYEFEKIYQYKNLYIGIGGVFIISLLFSMIINTESAFMVPMTSLVNMNNLYLLVIALVLSSSIFGVELECKTLKILRCKNIFPWKVVAAKYRMSILYALVLFFIPFVVSTIAGLALLPQKDFDFIGRNNTSIIITALQGMWLVVKAYLFQWIVSIFIISLTMFLTITFNSHAISTVCAFFSFYL